ncbi:MAG: hypothetical protein ABI134_21270 [Byssovorax sp.]
MFRSSRITLIAAAALAAGSVSCTDSSSSSGASGARPGWALAWADDTSDYVLLSGAAFAADYHVYAVE